MHCLNLIYSSNTKNKQVMNTSKINIIKVVVDGQYYCRYYSKYTVVYRDL